MQRATTDVLYFEIGPANLPTLRVEHPGSTQSRPAERVPRGVWSHAERGTKFSQSSIAPGLAFPRGDSK